jgi:hypothetical protein
MLTQSAAAKQRRHYLLSAQAPGIMAKLYSQGRAGKAPLLQALQKATSAFAASMFRLVLGCRRQRPGTAARAV